MVKPCGQFARAAFPHDISPHRDFLRDITMPKSGHKDHSRFQAACSGNMAGQLFLTGLLHILPDPIEDLGSDVYDLRMGEGRLDMDPIVQSGDHFNCPSWFTCVVRDPAGTLYVGEDEGYIRHADGKSVAFNLSREAKVKARSSRRLRARTVETRSLLTGSKAPCSSGVRRVARQRAQDWITGSGTRPEGPSPCSTWRSRASATRSCAVAMKGWAHVGKEDAVGMAVQDYRHGFLPCACTPPR